MNCKITTIAVAGAIAFGVASVALAEDAKAIFDAKCAMCHGKDGKGQTPVGKKMNLKDYTDATVQESFKDEDLAKAIKEGVHEGGKTRMKAFDKLTDAEVNALVKYIRAFKK